MRRRVLFVAVLFFVAGAGCASVDPRTAAGLEAFERQDYAAAMGQWRQAAEEGDAEARNGVGWLFAKGLGVPTDHEQAARWFALAAGQGHAGGQLNLGNLYDDGLGVPKDYAEAARWFGLAAAAGIAEAQANLGMMYKTGQGGLPLDYEKAAQWLLRAARQGYPPAQNSLGILLFKGLGVAQNTEDALFWIDQAVRNELPGAEHNREFVAAFLSPGKLAKIEDRAADWQPAIE